MSGSHRVRRVEHAHPRRRRAAVAGAAGAAGAVIVGCAVAAYLVLAGGGASGDGTGRVVGSATETSRTAGGEHTTVPDPCTIVGQGLVDRLAPGAERSEGDSYQGDDRRDQCVWGAYAGDAKRQLTVELRAVPGSGSATPTQAARTTFASERAADESGKGLLTGQKLTDKARLTDVGDEGYVVYSVDGQGSGEAIGNVRLGNVLVTVHYSGSDGGEPLSSRTATGGTVDVAKAVVRGLDRR